MRDIRGPPMPLLHHRSQAASPGPPRPAPHLSLLSHHESVRYSPCATTGSRSKRVSSTAATPLFGDSVTAPESSCCPTRARATEELGRRATRAPDSKRLSTALRLARWCVGVLHSSRDLLPVSQDQSAERADVQRQEGAVDGVLM